MGSFKDLTGQRFGFLSVEKRIENYVSSGGNSFVQYRCKCDCGQYKDVTALKLKTGHVKSCGKCGVFSTFKDLTNQHFDKLTVLNLAGYYVYPDGTKDARWLCQCDCGNFIVIRGNSLKSKEFGHSCEMCRRHARTLQDDDMLGRVFGRLTVIARLDDVYVNGNVKDVWKCRCECGSELSVRGASLRNGHTQSCGCYRLEMLANSGYSSKYEDVVANVLSESGVEYDKQKTFPDLVGLGGNLLSYDFCLESEKTLIECQGQQHYEAVSFFGGNRAFGIQKVHDYRKREYAPQNGYRLLEIKCYNTTPEKVKAELISLLGI